MRRAAQYIRRALQHYDTAFDYYARYTLNPGTPTGKRERSLYMKHRRRAEELLQTARDALAKADGTVA